MASKSCCVSVDNFPARSKNMCLGQQQLYIVPDRSTAQVAILVLPPLYNVIEMRKSEVIQKDEN